MYILTRNCAKRVRSNSMESDSSILTSPPMGRRTSRQISNDSVLSDNCFSDNVNRQISRESNYSDISGADNACIEETCQEDDEATKEEVPVKQATKEITCQFLRDLNPKTRFDLDACVISGVAFTAKGDILISDSGNKKVKRFDCLGQLKVECSIPDSYGRFVEPAGLCVLKSGDIIVADRGAGDMKVFTAEGRFLTRFGKDLNKPVDVISNSQGHVIITDEGCQDVFVYRSLSDKGIIKINKQTNGQKLHQTPKGVTVAKDDEIVVTDSDTNSVFRYSCYGKYVAEYAVHDNQSSLSKDEKLKEKTDNPPSSNSVSPSLSLPLGIANDRDNHVLLVDSGNTRVVRLDLTMNSLTKEILSFCDAPDGCPAFSPLAIATSYQGCLAITGKNTDIVKIYRYLEND